MSETYEGSVDDKSICDEEFTAFPIGIKLHQDTGFQGHLPKGVEVIQPLKKPKGKQLTAEQKQDNKAKSSMRVVVEHAIGGLKSAVLLKIRFVYGSHNLKTKSCNSAVVYITFGFLLL